MAVGAQGRRAQAASAAQQKQTHPTVDTRRHQRDREPETDVLERLRLQQPSYGGNSDADSRHDDQDTLQGAGEVFSLRVAVGMLLIGRTSSRSQGQESPYRRYEIYSRLGRVGEQAYGARKEVSSDLERNGNDRCDDRQPCIKQRSARRGLLWVSLQQYLPWCGFCPVVTLPTFPLYETSTGMGKGYRIREMPRGGGSKRNPLLLASAASLASSVLAAPVWGCWSSSRGSGLAPPRLARPPRARR